MLVGPPITIGLSNNPYAPDSYKRAIYLPTPNRFAVEFLEPAKQGHSFSYGMRINAVDRENRAYKATANHLSEYEIWRRWEDCLFFQDALEQEYSRLAREKKQRLLRGKGVKKNGFYMQDRAASFESLPPGPHPDSVAQDIHIHLPRLTKNGTLFWASQATINQRNSELRALVEALYQDDLPTLIREIRDSRVVTDFFGYWRRDFDLDETTRKRMPGSSGRRAMSSHFAPSNTSFSLQDGSNHDVESTTSTKRRPLTTSAIPSPMSAPDILRSRYYPSRHNRDHSIGITSLFSRPASRPRAISNASTDSSSSGSDQSSHTSTISSVPAIVDEVPIIFGHNPQHQTETNSREGPQPILEALPQDREIHVKADALALMTSLAVKRRRRSGTAMLQLNRYGQYRDYSRPPLSPTASELTTVPEQERPDEEPRCAVRESWVTTDSAATYLDGLKLSLPFEDTHRTSVATFMTTDSAEAVVRCGPPSRSLPTSPITHSVPKSRLSQAVTLSDFEMWTDVDDDDYGLEIESALGTGRRDSFPRPISLCDSFLDNRSEIESVLGTSNRDSFPRPISLCDSFLDYRSETPLGYRDTPTSPTPGFVSPSPPSPTTSISSGPISISELSTMSSVAPEGMISIKAALNQSIVVLRVPNEIGYEDLRERLYDKFVGQEGLTLSKSFTITLTNPTRLSTTSTGRRRSGSVERMEFISSASDWDNVASSYDGRKLTLRILDIPS